MNFISFSKYKAIKTVVDGIRFDSKAEASYYLFLKQWQEIGGIKILELQPRIYLTRAKILYKPDFLIEKNGEKIYIDVKGFKTPVFALKMRLWKHYGSGKLQIIKGKNITEIENQG